MRAVLDHTSLNNIGAYLAPYTILTGLVERDSLVPHKSKWARCPSGIVHHFVRFGGTRSIATPTVYMRAVLIWRRAPFCKVWWDVILSDPTSLNGIGAHLAPYTILRGLVERDPLVSDQFK